MANISKQILTPLNMKIQETHCRLIMYLMVPTIYLSATDNGYVYYYIVAAM